MKSVIYFCVFVLTAFFSTGHCLGQTTTATTKHPYGLVNEKIDALDVLTDTQGVDFGPYISGIIHSVSVKWGGLVPEVALPPQMKDGQVVAGFSISRTGSVDDPHIITTSGDKSLDAACAKAIVDAAPFGPLPAEFKGKDLQLRIHFHYNPQKTKSQASTP
ncbi:MAG TPA: TonB family protein [Terriglobales bacterium]|nr:TonB family protein [Terriglobales bacterium]